MWNKHLIIRDRLFVRDFIYTKIQEVKIQQLSLHLKGFVKKKKDTSQFLKLPIYLFTVCQFN